MNRDKIIGLALENLGKLDLFKVEWQHHGEPGTLDGTIHFHYNGQKIELPVDVRKELRASQLLQVEKIAKEHKNGFMMVAYRIEPKVKEELRRLDIPYLESNGNLFLHRGKLFLWLDHSKPLKLDKESGNRAFTKTGLRAVFHFLRYEDDINLPYRTVGEKTGTALGNVPNILKGLKVEGFLLQLSQKEYRLQHKKELLDKWAAAYQQDLKPSLHIGTFRFLKPEDFHAWKQLHLKSGRSWWGGEPAADLYTNYLKPEKLSIYTLESRSELMKNYRLVPDPKGNVLVYEKFWNEDEGITKLVPPHLVYADLMSTGDRRCLETAEKIYHELLQDKL